MPRRLAKCSSEIASSSLVSVSYNPFALMEYGSAEVGGFFADSIIRCSSNDFFTPSRRWFLLLRSLLLERVSRLWSLLRSSASGKRRTPASFIFLSSSTIPHPTEAIPISNPKIYGFVFFDILIPPYPFSLIIRLFQVNFYLFQ